MKYLQRLKKWFIHCVSNSSQNVTQPTDANNSFLTEKKYNIDTITVEMYLSTWDYQNNKERLVKKELLSEISKRLKYEIISERKDNANGWDRDVHIVRAECKFIFID